MKNKETNFIRLNKAISDTGLCSRRKADELIQDSKVKVNGQTINTLGYKVDTKNDKILVNGKRLFTIQNKEYKCLVLNKPKGFITTKTDPENRPTVMDLIPKKYRNLKPVGRLDFNTEGILIFTDDGELLYRLTHPKFQINRTYLVRAKGTIAEEKFKNLTEIKVDGIEIKDFIINNLRYSPSATWFEITIAEGKNREVRKIVEAMGSEVSRLTRIAYGTIYKAPAKGKTRLVEGKEKAELYKLVNM